jgi:hypothetical protein
MPSFANVHQLSEWTDYIQIGLRQVYEDTIPQIPKQYESWLREVKAKDWTENKIVNTGLGAMPTKTVGGDFSTDKKITATKNAYSLTAYGLGVLIEYELVAWDKYDIFTDMTKELAKATVDRLNIIAYSIPNNAFGTTTGYTIYNGEAIFKNSHTRLDGGTWKNRPDTDVSLSYLALQQARIDLAILQNERGRYTPVRPKTLLCSEANRWIADTIVKTDKRPGTADHDINTVASWGMSVESSPFLTTDENFFVFGPKDNVQIELRMGHEPQYRQDYDVRNWNQIISCYMSVGIAVLHSQGAWGSAP